MKKKLMKYRFILVLVVIAALTAALFVLNDYRLDIDESEVVCVSFYNGSSISKKVITNAEDIRTIVNTIDSLHSWGKYDVDDLPDGGIVYYLDFELGNATRLIIYNQTDHDGHGFFNDGDIRIKVSGLNLEELWNSLDYEAIEAKPALELFSD